jgi:hypothetical protein
VRHYDARHMIEERDGGWFVGEVKVTCWPGGRPDEEVREALCLPRHSRVRRCLACKRPFIGHWHAMTCSPDCARARVQQKYEAAKAIEAQRRAERNQRIAAEKAKREAERARNAAQNAWYCRPLCDHCRKNMIRTRSTRRFCSNACRQAAYREAHS